MSLLSIKIRSVLERHLVDNKGLLDSSRDKEIVVLLGSTGAGKSTTINFLIGKEMHNVEEDYQLNDLNDNTCMKIGMGGQSETLLPRAVKIGELVYYDLPGFDDTRGLEINLLNASFIKSIVENAKSVRLVFVAGQDQITSDRGKSFKNFLKLIKILLPHLTAIQNSSILIITKSIKNDSAGQIEYLKKKIGEEIEDFETWLQQDRISPISKKIDLSLKNLIIQKIQNLEPSEIKQVNIDAIYSSDVRDDLRQIFRQEMCSSLERVDNGQPKQQIDLDVVNQQILYYQNTFGSESRQELQNSIMIRHMRPLSEKIFKEEEKKFLIEIQNKINSSLFQLDAIKQRLLKEQVERKGKQDYIKAQQDKIEADIKEAKAVDIQKGQEEKIKNLKQQALQVQRDREREQYDLAIFMQKRDQEQAMSDREQDYQQKQAKKDREQDYQQAKKDREQNYQQKQAKRDREQEYALDQTKRDREQNYEKEGIDLEFERNNKVQERARDNREQKNKDSELEFKQAMRDREKEYKQAKRDRERNLERNSLYSYSEIQTWECYYDEQFENQNRVQEKARDDREHRNKESELEFKQAMRDREQEYKQAKRDREQNYAKEKAKRDKEFEIAQLKDIL